VPQAIIKTTANGPSQTDARRRALRGRSVNKTSLLAPLFIITFVIPVYFYLGPLRLAPFLLFLIVGFIPLFFVWISGRAGKIRLPDLLILFSSIWGGLALCLSRGVGAAIEPAGILILQTFGAFLMGRCLVRNKATFDTVLRVQIAILLLFFPFALLETRTGAAYYLQVFSKIAPTYGDSAMDPRMGLHRVQGAFEHPILFGIFVSSTFSLLFYALRGRLRIIMLSVSLALSIMSVSTGAMVCIFAQCGMIAWDRLFCNDPKRWRNLAVFCLLLYVTVDLLSNRTPFNVFVDYLTFNSGSAYNRILIWKYGTAEVWRHPLFGIGLNEWLRAPWMSPSMDNFWLVIAVRYGLPSLIMLSTGFFLVLFQAGKQRGLDRETARIRRGMVLSIVGVFVAICSVHLWNATFCWMMFLIGSTVWIGEETSAQSRPTKRAPNFVIRSTMFHPRRSLRARLKTC
jgi:hypothetical protein